jgi:o-succinylbenzoate---CoA ligase
MVFWVHLAAGKHPNRVALESADREISYAALSAQAIEGCRALQARGVGGGDRVALEIEDPVEFAVAMHVCLSRCAAAVPIDLRLSAAERAARSDGAAAVLTEAPGPGTGVLFPATGPSDGTIATVMHTSGTTAAPRPVELTYGNWLANALGSAVVLGLDLDERWLCVLPLAHVGGLSILIRSVIYGTTVVLHERFDTERVVTALVDPAERITLVSLVPTMLTRLLDAGLHDPPTLRWALLGGGPIPDPLLERAQDAGVPVAPTYGMTEACSQIATHGLPLPGVDILTSGGEVLVRGATVSAGALAPDGWLHTGDLGEFDERGRLVITGRKADTIVTGGENVAPGEVEAVLLEHPAVADAAVHGRQDPEWGEAVVATIVLRGGAGVGADALREHCAARLAAFKVPKSFEFAQRLPRSETGKLMRRELV